MLNSTHHPPQLLLGAPPALLSNLRLHRDPSTYRCTRQGAPGTVSGGSGRDGGIGGGSGGTQPLKPPLTLPQAGGEDAAAYRAVTEAMATIGFSPEEVGTVCRVLATILLLVRAPPQYGPVQTSAPHPVQQYEPPQPVQPPCAHTHQ